MGHLSVIRNSYKLYNTVIIPKIITYHLLVWHTAGQDFFLLSRELGPEGWSCRGAEGRTSLVPVFWSVWELLAGVSFTRLYPDPSKSDCRRHLVELHSEIDDMASRFTGPGLTSSLRERPPGGLVLRRKRVARWNRPSRFFFSSRSSGSSLGAPLHTSRRSKPKATDARMEAQPKKTMSVRRRVVVRFRLLVGVCCGVVLVELVEVVGSSWFSPPPAGPWLSPCSSFHRGRSIYTWLGNLSCFGLLSDPSAEHTSSLLVPGKTT